MKQTIQFQQIKANTLVNASAIFVGTNQTGNWSSHEKENYLLTIHGHQTYVVNNINIIEDKYLIDTVINDQDTAISMPRHTENVSLTDEWDKVFLESDTVNHRKVTFQNRYGITLVADL